MQSLKMATTLHGLGFVRRGQRIENDYQSKPRNCVICGDEFQPEKANNITCPKFECKKQRQRNNAREYARRKQKEKNELGSSSKNLDGLKKKPKPKGVIKKEFPPGASLEEKLLVCFENHPLLGELMEARANGQDPHAEFWSRWWEKKGKKANRRRNA